MRVSGLQLLIVGEHELRVVGSLTKDCIEDVPLVERFTYLVLTRMPGEVP